VYSARWIAEFAYTLHTLHLSLSSSTACTASFLACFDLLSALWMDRPTLVTEFGDAGPEVTVMPLGARAAWKEDADIGFLQGRFPGTCPVEPVGRYTYIFTLSSFDLLRGSSAAEVPPTLMPTSYPKLNTYGASIGAHEAPEWSHWRLEHCSTHSDV
jgi:hypothetical protein